MLLGGGISAGLISLHVVRSPQGIFAVRKTRPSVHDAYIDIRKWKRAEWKNHPELIKALKESGHADLIPQQRPDVGNPIREFWKKLNGKQKAAGKETEKRVL